MEIIWRSTALDDIEHARRYIARRNPAAGARVFCVIRTEVRRLAMAPHLGRPGRVDGTRELVIPDTPYLVAYAVIDESVVILAVLHGPQEWPEGF